MNGPHDMGGFTRFGPINPEVNEPVFHTEWERRAFALALAMGMTGSWNIDISRHARERIPAEDYWAASYYEIWTMGLERLVDENPIKDRVAKAAMIPAILSKGGPASRPSNLPQGFHIGDKVRARNMTPEGHTRLARYVRGRMGEIVTVHGTHVLPDSSAHGQGDNPQWLYTVRFTARELWGKDTNDAVMVDLWEPYLEAV